MKRVLLMALVIGLATAAGAENYPSPVEVKYSPDGSKIGVCDAGLQCVQWIDVASGKVVRSTARTGVTAGIAFAGNTAVVADKLGNSILQIKLDDGSIAGRMPAGWWPAGVAVAPKRGWVLVCNVAAGNVSAIGLADGKEKANWPVVREPYRVAITPDESLAVVSNLLPGGASTDPEQTTCVSLIETANGKRVDIKLPPNSTCARGVTVSTDGKWAYVVHTMGRSNLPATQLDRGWVNTNALTIIDLAGRSLYATVLLDNLYEGAADPWGMAITRDGSLMWITIAGTHELARIELARLHQLLAGQGTPPAYGGTGSTTVWEDIRKDGKKRSELTIDLAAMHVAGLIQRIKLPGKGPRGIDLSPDGKTLAVALYFSGQVVLADSSTGKVTATIATAAMPAVDETRKGEMIFHDAYFSFQHWLSCATCHPNEARVDGLNWDLPNDGIGNPKNNKSLLDAHLTGPSMWLGVREGMDAASAAGFRFAARQPAQDELTAVQAYIRSLTPLPSPRRLADGSLSEKAKKGKLLFESDAVGCAHCHPAPLYTNLKKFNVGTRGELDHEGQDTFDTPSLIEVWRTAPYMHDGRAATLEDMLTRLNPGDKHGQTSKLSREEIDNLVEFLDSIDGMDKK